jgi:hypothetical protein
VLIFDDDVGRVLAGTEPRLVGISRSYCASRWVRFTNLFGISELKNGLISQRTGRNLDEYAGIEVVRWEQFA